MEISYITGRTMRKFIFITLLLGLILSCNLEQDKPTPVKTESFEIIKRDINNNPIFNSSELAGNYLFTTFIHNKQGIKIFDISDPQNPQLVSTYESKEQNEQLQNFYTIGNYIYLSFKYSDIEIIDINDTSKPVFIKNISKIGDEVVNEIINIRTDNNTAFFSIETYPYNELILIVDITDPVNPQLLSKIEKDLPRNGYIANTNNFLYYINSVNGEDNDTVFQIDISDLKSPKIIDTYTTNINLEKTTHKMNGHIFERTYDNNDSFLSV